MPNEVVWVDKIINPRSVVLTYNEAMTVLKKAKVTSGRSQFVAAECKPSTSTAAIKIEDLKEECLNFLALHAYEMEKSPIITMQEELQSITASKIAFDEAVNKKVLFADGLPRLKPSVLLKNNILKKQKDKKKFSVGSNLANVAGTAINKKVLENLYKDNDEDILVLSSSESETNDTEEPSIKRKRIVISDDEDIEDNVVQEFPTSSTKLDTVKSIDEAVVQSANNGDIFKEAFNSCIAATSDDPITITFEANDNGVNVIASSTNVLEIINDVDIPNNVMFTDKAVSSLLNLPISSVDNSAEALRLFWFGKREEQPGNLVLLKKNDLKVSNLKLHGKLPYSEMVKDEKFCSKLLDTFESDIDVTPFLDLYIEKCSGESDYLPRQCILNSLFSTEDLEMMKYENEMKKFNSNRVREKQRVQHPFVKIMPRSSLNLKTAHLNIEKSSIIPAPKSIDYGIKGILKKFDANDSTSAQISMKNQLISHNTVIHEALKYLLKNKSTKKTSEEIQMAYDKLKKYPLTFLEKFNLITTMPKDLSGILCLLDDLGLRFGKESLAKLEADCISLFGNSKKKEEQEEEEESEKILYDPEVAKKKVRFSKTVEHRFL
uniref:Uncharacterized protein n=1 Tax=Panagrolaimus superbus TaxID=310955 RepID=A0A914YUE1_9BILA